VLAQMGTDAGVHQFVRANDPRGCVVAEWYVEHSLGEVAARITAPRRAGRHRPRTTLKPVLSSGDEFGMESRAHANAAIARASRTLNAFSPKTSWAARWAPHFERRSSKA